MVTVGTDPVQDIIAVGVLAISYLSYKANNKAKENGDKIDTVHTLVNSQLTDVIQKKDDAEVRADTAEAKIAELEVK